MENKQTKTAGRMYVICLELLTITKPKDNILICLQLSTMTAQSHISLCYTFTTVSVTLLNKYFILPRVTDNDKANGGQCTSVASSCPQQPHISLWYWTELNIYYTFTAVILGTRASFASSCLQWQSWHWDDHNCHSSRNNIQYMSFVSS